MSICELRPYCGHDAAEHTVTPSSVPGLNVVRCRHCPCRAMVKVEERPADAQEPLPLAPVLQFSAEISEAIKRRILMLHEERNAEKLKAAREIADRILTTKETVTADEVHEEFDRIYGEGLWDTWAGTLFRDKRYRAVGFAPSPVVQYHANIRRVWGRATQ